MVDTAFSSLDLKLGDSSMLGWSSKPIVEKVSLGVECRRWREASPLAGERWLRNAAASGDFHAMERLGIRLINGDGLAGNLVEGLGWLRQSAQRGNPVAMAHLGECMLDTEGGAESREEGQRWLEKAMALGLGAANVAVASRLITGSGLVRDPERGKRMLMEAAGRGSQLAHVKLAVYLLSGRELSADRAEAFRWLRRVGTTQASHLALLAYYLYMKSLAASTPGSRRVLAEESAVLMQESVRQGNVTDELNLVYLLRRGEISPTPYPPIESLLSAHLQAGNPFALVNQALRLARGWERAVDWKAADAAIARIANAEAVMHWWFARCEHGDAEGDLVTGWLVRHRLALDPDGLTHGQRLERARAGGWDIPGWLSRAVHE